VYRGKRGDKMYSIIMSQFPTNLFNFTILPQPPFHAAEMDLQ